MPAGVVNVEGTPRTVAGDAITTDTNKCQLKPLKPHRLPGHHVHRRRVGTLEQTFPEGVCDFSKPGVAQQPTVPWLTYQDATVTSSTAAAPRPNARLHRIPRALSGRTSYIASGTNLYR